MSVQLIIGSLSQMDAQQSALLEMMLQKKQAILDRDFDGLVRILSRESKMLKSIEELEQQLLTVAQTFLQSKGIKSKLNLTITEISRLVFDPEEKRMLMELKEKLEGRLAEVKRVNALNQELIKQNLSFIDFSLNLMIGNEDDDTTYSPPTGQDRKSATRRMFDTRA
ncbi:flagellar protein FlgN [Paenibacillus sp. FSL R5-0527]|uniref:FlgN family protein n=1 Tax=Paenibacillus macerans TaxID=44252 RepID=A0A090Z9B3_PAEMA|nr:flagellar protein FlgN [Paenibacillus macerans]KFN07864.1 flgN family protein [Paenibacillus macerans]MCY7560677.1 flagellar protein FlgN [Paenibacillus macerans]MEC0150686.1 flagellar protein FlgN [Paenibacillus macerans]MEC0328170.1 flagellar protein FlgN [Paenibacillus macerans]MED4954433.1 flagellar protein FlgN [Paenibacillus macerans]